MNAEESLIRWSSENIIEHIREHRDELIVQLIDHDALLHYLLEQYKIPSTSELKLEFIIKALQELKSSPIDLSFYAHLILDIRKKDSVTIPAYHEKLFRDDIHRTISNYL